MQFFLTKSCNALLLWCWTLGFTCITAPVFGQLPFLLEGNIAVTSGLNTQAMPWTGGLNNPQFSEVDLNNDGIQDLFIFDRTGDKVLTFLNSGTPNTIAYTYAPELATNFPKLSAWALIRDFNCDGIGDIFTYHPGRISVYAGSYDMNNHIEFTLYDDTLEFNISGQWVNIPVTAVDLPAIDDIDNDGDLDIINPGQFGSTLVLYENLADGNGNPCHKLEFDDSDLCWGNFLENGNGAGVELGVTCKGGSGGGDPEGARHAGGTTILTFDNDGDGDKEAILGDNYFDRLTYLTNGGTPTLANMTAQDTLFPVYDVTFQMETYPASYLMDVNNDGLKDLMVAPHSEADAENLNCAWLYENIGDTITAIFDLQNDSFMVGDMIDVGTGAYPVFVDVDGNGVLDLVIGNEGYFTTNGLQGTLTLYTNTGTQNQPIFELTDRNFLQLDTLNLNDLVPTFGDLDADGDEDLIIGEMSGSLILFENLAGAGNPMVFAPAVLNFMGINVLSGSAPQIVDVNKDNQNDLLVGAYTGQIWYYEKSGLPTDIQFTFVTDFFGGVKTIQSGWSTGYNVPFLTTLDTTGTYYLLCGSQVGHIWLYGDIDNNLGGNFTLIDSYFSKIDEGDYSSVFGADIDNDGEIELITGNQRGGVSMYGFAPPMVDFVWTDACEGDTTFFTNQTFGSDTFTWYFEDTANGNIDSTNNFQPAFVFPGLGSYLVTLNASNVHGTSTVSQWIVIHQHAPVADFSFGADKDTAVFQNHSTGNGIYIWDFGDGTMDTIEDDRFVHMYPPLDGVYTVTLITINACGSDTIDQEIAITDPFSGIGSFQRLSAEIYPNPNDGNFYIKLNSFEPFELLQLTLYHVNGQKVWQQEVEAQPEQIIPINLRQVLSGVYFIQIKGSGQPLRRKIVIH